MTGKIKVKICTGTTCYIMGSGDMAELASILQNKYPKTVEVEAVVCHGLCGEDSKYSRAPYVKVDGDIISEATVEKVLAAIDRKLAK